METFTTVIVLIFLILGLIVMGIIVIGFFKIMLAILCAPIQPNTNLNNDFDSDEPDGSNYYEVNGQVRLE